MTDFTGKHILGNFENALQKLQTDVLRMAALAQQNLANAEEGLFSRDDELSNRVIADDEEVDAFEIQIDREGVEILLRFHPLASDLRRVVSAMKSSINIERIADQSVSIARRAKKLSACNELTFVHQLKPMFMLATTMFQDAVDAYTQGNVELARSLKPRDKELDRLNHEFTEICTKKMAQESDVIQEYLNLIFIARFLERIGDHATNLGEDIVFSELAEETRHSQGMGPNL